MKHLTNLLAALILLLIMMVGLMAPVHAQTRTLLFEDTFTRPDSGEGNVGNGWYDLTGKYQILSNTLTAEPIASPGGYSFLNRPSVERPKNVTVELTTGNWVAGTAPSIRLCTRYANNSNFYILDINLNAGFSPNTGTISIRKMVSGVTTSIVTQPFPLVAGNRYAMSFSVVGINPAALTATVSDLGPDGQGTPSPPITVSASDNSANLQVSGSTALQLGHYRTPQPGLVGIAALTRYAVYAVNAGVNLPPRPYPINDGSIFTSPGNWRKGGTPESPWMQANVSGAYIKSAFFGTSCSLLLDTSPNASMPAAAYPRISYSIDNLPFVHTQLQPGATRLNLAYGLADGKHQILVYYRFNSQSYDLWGSTGGSAAQPINVWRVTGLEVDGDASLSPPTLRPNRMLIYGDSITRAAWDKPDQSDADSFHSYAIGLANLLDAEFGMVAHGGQGWNLGVLSGANVPQFISSWNRIDAFTLLDTSQHYDYVVNAHCRNGWFPASLVSTWLPQARQAFGPDTIILMMTAFSGTNRDQHTPGVNNYLTATGDPRTFLIDPKTDALVTGQTYTSPDGIHPNVWAHGVLLAPITRALYKAVPPALLP